MCIYIYIHIEIEMLKTHKQNIHTFGLGCWFQHCFKTPASTQYPPPQKRSSQLPSWGADPAEVGWLDRGPQE